VTGRGGRKPSFSQRKLGESRQRREKTSTEGEIEAPSSTDTGGEKKKKESFLVLIGKGDEP